MTITTNEKLESKMLVSFIALIIRNEIHQGLKVLNNTKKKDFTVPQVLGELELLRVTKLSDNRYHIRYNLTGKQKMIISAFEGSEKEYVSYAKQVKISFSLA